jgi:hypothetical protein
LISKRNPQGNGLPFALLVLQYHNASENNQILLCTPPEKAPSVEVMELKKCILPIMIWQILLLESLLHLCPRHNVVFPFMFPLFLKVLPQNRSMLPQLDGNKLQLVMFWNIFVIKDSLNGVKPINEFIRLHSSFKFWNVHLDQILECSP